MDRANQLLADILRERERRPVSCAKIRNLQKENVNLKRTHVETKNLSTLPDRSYCSIRLDVTLP